MSYVRFVALLGATFAFATGAMAAPPLEDYAKLPQVGDIDISPKGDHIAVLASVGDEGRLIVRDVATGQPLLAVNTGTVKVHDIRWMGNNHIAIRISQTITNNPFISNDKIEVYQTTVYNIVTKKSTIIFRTSARKIFPATYSYFGYSTSNGHEYGYFDGEPLKSTTGIRKKAPASFPIRKMSGWICIASISTPTRSRRSPGVARVTTSTGWWRRTEP
jgi:hypothetical protein